MVATETNKSSVLSPSVVPIPDPSDRTEQEIARRLQHEREYAQGQLSVLKERVEAMDKATKLLNEQMTRVPTDVDRQVGHLKELHDEKFESVAKQFLERDTRSERESRDNKVAVDAAFAAQKEAASEQNKSNTLAIDKSEKATAETLNKQADLFQSATDALSDKIEDMKARHSELALLVNGLIQAGAGGHSAVTSQREATANTRANVAIGISALLAILTIVTFIVAIANSKPN